MVDAEHCYLFSQKCFIINVWQGSLNTSHTAQKMKFSILNFFSKYDHVLSFLQIYEDDTAQEVKFSIKYFFSKCDQIRSNCGFGHIYWRNP